MNRDKEQDLEIKNMVSWKVFCWAMSVILILFGTAFAIIQTISIKIDGAVIQYTEIKVQLSQIQTDLLWIKDALITKD